jgi:hypothetical protein
MPSSRERREKPLAGGLDGASVVSVDIVSDAKDHRFPEALRVMGAKKLHLRDP